MLNALFLRLKKLACSDDEQDNNQTTITIGKLIREMGLRMGQRPSLKKVRRELEELANDGLIRIDPLPPGPKLLSPFNRPLLITLTESGRAHAILEQNKEAHPGNNDKPGRLPSSPGSKAMYLSIKAQAVIDYLVSSCRHYGKNYCYPARETIVKNCREWYGVRMSTRSLDRILPRLEAEGWIRKVCRHKKLPDGKWEFRSTLYELSGKLFAWAKKTAHKLGKFFAGLGSPDMANNLLLKKSIIRGDSTFSGVSPPILREKGAPTAKLLSDEDRQANLFSIKTLISSLG